MKKEKIIELLNNIDSDEIAEINIELGLKRDYIAIVYKEKEKYRKKDAIYAHE